MEENILKELAEIKRLTTLSAKGRVLLSQDVSILTGLSLSTIYKKTSSNSIPFYKNNDGKLLFFDRGEIENWCLKHSVKTSDEIETEAATYCVTGKRKGITA